MSKQPNSASSQAQRVLQPPANCECTASPARPSLHACAAGANRTFVKILLLVTVFGVSADSRDSVLGAECPRSQQSLSVSGLALDLLSPVLETEEIKPNPMCVFRCRFWWAGEVWVLHWKRLWFRGIASVFCDSPSRGASVCVSAFIVTGL